MVTSKEPELFFLIHGILSWSNKDFGSFDVTMESYHRAEICEFVGLLILSMLSKELNLKHKKMALALSNGFQNTLGNGEDFDPITSYI